MPAHAIVRLGKLEAGPAQGGRVTLSPGDDFDAKTSLTAAAQAVAEVLQRSPFYVMMSTHKPAEWWSYGLVKAQPVAKLSGFRTTGGEGMTCWVYVNMEKVPGQ